MNRFIVVGLIYIIGLCLASYGDIEPNFRRCVDECLHKGVCSDKKLEAEMQAMHPVRTWLFSFVSRTCHERCEYRCMTEITEQRRVLGLPVYKYHGHWAFTRYWGLEEPASVVFSLANGVPHVWQLWRWCATGGKKSWQSYFMMPYLVLYPLVALTAWLSSAVFHAKKTPRATLIDYSTALVFLAYGLWLTLRRVIGPRTHRSAVTVLFLAGCTLLAWRLDCMWRGRVTYDSHMHLCIAIAVTTISLWGLWIVCGGGTGTNLAHPHNRFRCLACQIAFAAASMLELFDFPPLWGVFDAHSLWHLATVPLGFLWYTFWQQDRRNIAVQEHPEKAKSE